MRFEEVPSLPPEEKEEYPELEEEYYQGPEWIEKMNELRKRLDEQRAGIEEPLSFFQKNGVEIEIKPGEYEVLKPLLKEIAVFILFLTEQYREWFWKIFRKESKAGERLEHYIQEKRFDVPRFVILSSSAIQAGKLDEYYPVNEIIQEIMTEEYEDLETKRAAVQELRDLTTLATDQVILIFNLPKPVAHFWWKEMDQSGVGLIGWGNFYRRLMPVVWEIVGLFSCESNLIFERINACGEHDPKKFYYIWRVGLAKSGL